MQCWRWDWQRGCGFVFLLSFGFLFTKQQRKRSLTALQFTHVLETIVDFELNRNIFNIEKFHVCGEASHDRMQMLGQMLCILSPCPFYFARSLHFMHGKMPVLFIKDALLQICLLKCIILVLYATVIQSKFTSCESYHSPINSEKNVAYCL